MILYKKVYLFFKVFLFHSIFLYILILSPLGRYNPYLDIFFPNNHFYEILKNDSIQVFQTLISEYTYISILALPIIVYNFYFMYFNKFRKEKEDFIAVKMVIIILGSTILSFPLGNLFGSFNVTLPMFITTSIFTLFGVLGLKKHMIEVK